MLFVTQRYHGEGFFFKQKKKCCGNHKSFQKRDVISAKRVNMSSEKDHGAESGAETKMDP